MRGKVQAGTALGFAVVIGAVAVIGQGQARACSFGFPPYALDPAEAGVDTQRPATPVVSDVSVKRGTGPRGNGCHATASSCDDIGVITLHVAATDDRTPPGDMGFAVSVASGDAPADLSPLGQSVAVGADGTLTLIWLDGATNDQEEISWELTVRAVDKAGNISAGAATVSVYSGSTGCSISPGRRLPRSVEPIVVLVVAWLTAAFVLRRRRGRPG